MSEREVWVVTHGERNEGGNVVSVHSSKEGAIEAALQVKPCFPGGWEKEDDEFDYWVNGCDFVHVEPFDIQETPSDPESAPGGSDG